MGAPLVGAEMSSRHGENRTGRSSPLDDRSPWMWTLLCGAALLIGLVFISALIIWIAGPVPWVAVPFLASIPIAYVASKRARGVAIPALAIAAMTVLGAAFMVELP